MISGTDEKMIRGRTGRGSTRVSRSKDSTATGEEGADGVYWGVPASIGPDGGEKRTSSLSYGGDREL